MRSFSLLAFSLFILSNGNAQNSITDTTATVLAYFKKGDSAKYSLTIAHERYQDGKKYSTASLVYDLNISIADETDSNYIIYCTYSKIKANEGAGGNPIVINIGRVVEGATFKYSTDAGGQIKRLLNYNEVSSFMNKTLVELTKTSDDKRVQLVFEQKKKALATEKGVQELLMKDAQLLHAVYGNRYTLQKKITAETLLPNFLGGSSFPAIFTIEMTNLDTLHKTCTIIFDQALDIVKIKKELTDFLDKKEMLPHSQLPGMDISDHYSFDVDLVTGWMNKILYTRTATENGNTTIELHEIIKL